MRVWCMNLIDDRNENERNKDAELKFRLCKEKEILAIGWGVSKVVNSWQEYLEEADKIWKANANYVAGTNALKEMAYGDLVWVKNPVSGDVYLAEIVDNSPDPSIYRNLMEFDICAYRKCRYIFVEPARLTGSLSKKNLSARRVIERMSGLKQKTIDDTEIVFNELKKG